MEPVKILKNCSISCSEDFKFMFSLTDVNLSISNAKTPRASNHAIIHVSSSNNSYLAAYDFRYLVANGYSELAAFYCILARMYILAKYNVTLSDEHVKYVSSGDNVAKVSKEFIAHLTDNSSAIVNFVARLLGYYEIYAKVHVDVLRVGHLRDHIASMIAAVDDLALTSATKVMHYLEVDCLAPVHSMAMTMVFTNIIACPGLKGIVNAYAANDKDGLGTLAARLLVLANLLDAAISMSPVAEQVFPDVHKKVMLSLAYTERLIFERIPPTTVDSKVIDKKHVKALDDLTATLCAALKDSKYKKEWAETVIDNLAKHLTIKSPSVEALAIRKEIDTAGTIRHSTHLGMFVQKLEIMFNVDY